MGHSRSVAITTIVLAVVCSAAVYAEADLAPDVIETKRIWDAAPHNAFTDLVRWQDKFYCAFREGRGHAGDIGKLRIIVSQDGDKWASAGLLSLADYDLRDAALSVTPDGRLMVLGGVQQVRDGKHVTGTFVSFSADGHSFTPPKIVIPLGRWLWRVTWHDGVAYGVSYGTHDNRPWSALHKTKDGVHYETVTDELLGEGGWPTEARLRFAADGTCYCLHRRDGQGNTAYLGMAKPPYTDWKWHDLDARLGGPNFLQLPAGAWVGAGRLYDGGARTELVQLDVEQGKMTPLVRLPSGGDTSYPGMVWHNGILWVSYYASHEGKTSVYLSKVSFPNLATSGLLTPSVDAQQAAVGPGDPPKIGDTSVAAILNRLGATLEDGVTPDQQHDYSRLFDIVDHDGDGRHSQHEYIEKGSYLTPQARRGIFNAADVDKDGFVTKAEYILNRIITDEGKAIVQAMDDNDDGVVERGEFMKHATAKLSDAGLAGQVFAALDTDDNGLIPIPEYLRVWGQWARVGRLPPEKRIAVRENKPENSPQGAARERPQRRGRNGPPSGRPGRRPGPPSVAEVFERFDANQDGMLQKKEIPEFAQQFILPADANKDESVTKQELEKFRASRGIGSRGLGRPAGRGGPPGRNAAAFGPFSGNTDPVRLNRAGLKVGSQLPEVTVFDADGNEFETTNLKGSYSVLVFGCLT